MLAAKKMPISSQEFPDWELLQQERHEFIAGEIYAMAGASRSHEEVAGAAFVTLWNALFATPCRVYKGDRKVKVLENYLYPDVVVTCDERDHQSEGAIEHPRAIIEVASPGATASYDRDVKAQLYRSLPSLQEYVMIEPRTRRITLMLRRGDTWETVDLINSSIIVCGIPLEPTRIFANL
ncbi:MAG TPA: Uma2 family endonuclease [Rhodocyclaceae bacterium]|nr:Uma2 family endonuclease [Rhodocyclaceae bacterium]